MCYISYITCLPSLLTSHHALYCVGFMTEGPYTVPSFPDLRSWRQVTRSELKGPWHSLTTSQWTSEGMLLIDILKGALVRISSCKSQGDRSLLQQILTLHEITVWCLGKADISSGLRDIYQVFIPSGGKEVGGRVAWLSDSRVCVYFVLVSCQPLHAGFLRASECLLQHD